MIQDFSISDDSKLLEPKGLGGGGGGGGQTIYSARTPPTK